MLLIFRELVVVFGCLLAAYTDTKTGLIPDQLTYSMIALGIVFNLFEFNVLSFVIPAAVFAVGFVLYWFGKVGGGDVKLLTAIALLLPFFVGRIFVLHVLVVSAILALIFYSVFFVVRYWRKGIDFAENSAGIKRALLLFVVFSAYFYYLNMLSLIEPFAIAVFYATIVIALPFVALEKGIKRNFFLKNVSLSEMEEDEVVAEEFLDEGLAKKLNLRGKGIFGEKEIAALKQSGISTVPVYRSLPPFAPFIFLAVSIVILRPELLSFLAF